MVARYVMLLRCFIQFHPCSGALALPFFSLFGDAIFLGGYFLRHGHASEKPRSQGEAYDHLPAQTNLVQTNLIQTNFVQTNSTL